MDYTKQGVLVSVVVHIIILLLLIMLKIADYTPDPRELIEIIIQDPIPPRIIENIAAQSSQHSIASEQIVEEENPERMEEIINPPSNEIDTPTVENDYEMVDITTLPQNRQLRRPVSDFRATESSSLNPTHNPNIPSGANVSYHTTPHSNINLDGFTDEVKSRLGSTSVFDIAGDVVNRKLIKSVLPEYPPNVMKNGSVTMEFIVDVNGLVRNVQIIRGSEPEFSVISAEALRQWAFDRADREHSGRITFNFMLD